MPISWCEYWSQDYPRARLLSNQGFWGIGSPYGVDYLQWIGEEMGCYSGKDCEKIKIFISLMCVVAAF